MGATSADDGQQRRMPIGLPARMAAIGATAAVLTFLAPFGTGAVPVMRRAALWLATLAIWEGAVFAAGRVVLAWQRRRDRADGRTRMTSLPWRVVLVMVPVAAVPAIPLGLLVQFGRFPDLGACLAYGLNSIGLCLIVVSLRTRLRARSPDAGREWMPVDARGAAAGAASACADTSPGSAGSGMGVAAFLGRHAPALSAGRLLALQAEDHYLRIHTDRGQALVLQRLRDAVSALGAEAGVQVHRSYWVAGDAAPRATRRGQAWQLDLPGGLQVPVSKANVGLCRQRGWL